MVFTVLVAIIAGVGLWIALSSLENSPGSLELSTVAIRQDMTDREGDITLVAAVLPENEENLAEELVKNAKVKNLAGAHELLIGTTPNGAEALCVGIFTSEESSKLTELQKRFREFDVGGKHPFGSARPCRISD
jgi:hypothetical protein